MAGGTKNLGQVSGVHIGSTPPENINLIWYDDTPNQMLHKVYDINVKDWVVLNPNIISKITYTELVNKAKGVGLSVGQFFQITDKLNTLAMAITTTKVQYVDSVGNIYIDDLGTNIQYHVASSNLTIDDVAGVFDEVNKKITFVFKEQTPDFTADDYILAKVKKNNVWSLAKFKLSSFLSKVTGNSITWNGGFFFSFKNEIDNVTDVVGGLVSKATHDRNIETIVTSVNNVGKENQRIMTEAEKYADTATKTSAIFGKALDVDLSVSGEPIDVRRGDTIYEIVAKFQRWINKLKLATGVKLTANFTENTSTGKVNNNDTVETAVSKLQKQVTKNSEDIGATETNFGDLIEAVDERVTTLKQKVDDLDSDEIVMAKEDVTYVPVEEDFQKNWSIYRAISNLQWRMKNIKEEWMGGDSVGWIAAKEEILNHDIFRITLTTSNWNMNGSGVGGCMASGADSVPPFAYDETYPDNPYRVNPVRTYLIALAQITYFQTAASASYVVATRLNPYRKDGVGVQFQLHLSDAAYNQYKDGYLTFTFTTNAWGTVTAQPPAVKKKVSKVMMLDLRTSAKNATSGSSNAYLLLVESVYSAT